MNLAYKRILVKISGEQLAGPDGRGFDKTVPQQIAGEIKKALNLGVEVALVVGGGNLVRGNDVAGGGIGHVTAHYMGMLSTLINALAVGDEFNASDLPAVVLTNLEVNLAADLFTQRRAWHHMQKGRVVVLGGGLGRPFVTTDTGAVSLALELGCDVVCKVTKVDGVYDKDPVKFADAVKIDQLDFGKAVSDPEIRVMDKAAMGLAMENHQKIVVCDLKTPDNLKRLVLGEQVGTLIS
ncbi:MAG: UMP kinase [Candidatus Woesebacteria bacterium]|jgi:uridylate kinase